LESSLGSFMIVGDYRKRSELACLDSTTNSLARPSPCDVGSFSFKSRTLMVKQSQV
jgi:hypothetical protein